MTTGRINDRAAEPAPDRLPPAEARPGSGHRARSMAAAAAGGDWAERVRRLEAEVSGLRQAMRTRAIIEQAKGILAERLGIDPEAAYGRLSQESQRANVKLIDVATDVVAAADSGPPPDENPAISPGPARATPLTVEGDPPRVDQAGQRRARRLRASLPGAVTVAHVVEQVATEAMAIGARSVVCYATEPAGGLRLVAATGLAPQVQADWRHVPAALATTAALAVRRGAAGWYEPPLPAGIVGIGPSGPRYCAPLWHEPATAAVLELAWPEHRALGPTERDSIAAMVKAAIDRLTALPVAAWADPAAGPPPPGDWPAIAVDAALTPAAVLRPVWTQAGIIEDFVVDHLNAEALTAWSGGASPVGRRLLDVAPHLLVRGDFDALCAAYEGGGAAAPGLRAQRAGTCLIAAWQSSRVDGYRDPVLFSTMEQLGSFAWSVWTPSLSPSSWSSGLYLWLGRDPADGPLDLPRLLARVDPADRARFSEIMRAAAAGQGDSVIIGLQDTDDTTRSVRLVAIPRRAPGGGVRAVVTLLQDITDSRRRDDESMRIAQRLAAQRVRAASQQAQAVALRRTFYPPPQTELVLPGLEVLARHAAPGGIPDYRGDFYDVYARSDQVVLAVGDVFARGVDAAGAMLRLRHAARALTLAGLPPDEVLTLLNEEMRGDDEPPLASALIAVVRLVDSVVEWAQAGHYSPILLRSGRARSLRRPAGDALGLRPDSGYVSARTRLEPDDVLVCYTDGVLDRDIRGGHPVRRLGADLLAAHREGGARAVVGLPRPHDDEVCLVAVHRTSSPT